MKAAYIDRFGGPEVLQYGDLPDPVASAGQVVVDVAAASVNGADWRVRAGQYGQATFPLVLGSGRRLFNDGILPATMRPVGLTVTDLGIVIGTYEPAGPVRHGQM